MLHLAAEAAGVDIADCWYVGDTLDRDVVTGRRAGVGAVFITRSQHSDNPPFAVDAVPYGSAWGFTIQSQHIRWGCFVPCALHC